VNEDALRRIAERFRVLVERSQVRVGGRDLRITISLGGTIAEVGEAAETIFERADAALYRADAALYRAKEDGRNRVVMAVNAEASSPSA
jgi:GGDEF domain-containing protein